VNSFHVPTPGASKTKDVNTSTDTTTPAATQKKTLPNTGAKVLSLKKKIFFFNLALFFFLVFTAIFLIFSTFNCSFAREI
jgi:hypothetical protein